jgi:ankyrin repeat protein
MALFQGAFQMNLFFNLAISTLLLLGLKTHAIAMNESALQSLSLKDNIPSLHKAVQKNNLKDIKAICKSHPLTINDLNSEGYSALYLASSQGLADAAKIILSYDPMITQEGTLQKNPLHEAAKKGYTQIAKMLIGKMSTESINLLSGEKISALSYACYQDHSEVATLLIDAGAEVTLEREEKQWSPLHIALFHGHIETAKMICERFPKAMNLLTKKNFSTVSIALGLEDINTAKTLLEILIQNNVNKSLFSTPQAVKNLHKLLDKDPSLWKPYGEYAIKGAILKKDIEIIRILMEDTTKPGRRSFLSDETIQLAKTHNIDIYGFLQEIFNKKYGKISSHKEIFDSAKEFTSLLMAAEDQNLDKFKDLIAKGADIKSQNQQGLSLLNGAILHRGTPETIQFLIDNGAEVNPKDPQVNRPLATAIENNQIKLVEILINNGANIHYTGENGWTFLMIAVQTGNSEIADFLIKKGINVNKKTRDGACALGLAAEYGKTECIKILIDHGAEVNPKDCRVISPLFVAVVNNQKNAVETLIECGANVHQKMKNEWTLLMIAADYDHFATVKVLLEKGCDINQKSSDGQTALMIAKNKNHIDIVKLLKSHLKNQTKK